MSRAEVLCRFSPALFLQGSCTGKSGFSTAGDSKGCQFWVKLPALPALGALSPVCHHHTALDNDPSQLVNWKSRVPARQEPLQVWRPQKHVNRVKYFGNLWLVFLTICPGLRPPSWGSDENEKCKIFIFPQRTVHSTCCEILKQQADASTVPWSCNRQSHE